MQSGNYGGLVSAVIEAEGGNLLLEESVESIVEVGDFLYVVPYWTLNELFEFFVEGIASGETPEASDLITLLDPVSQVSKSYFLKGGRIGVRWAMMLPGIKVEWRFLSTRGSSFYKEIARVPGAWRDWSSAVSTLPLPAGLSWAQSYLCCNHK